MSGSMGEPVISADDADDVDGTEKGWPQISQIPQMDREPGWNDAAGSVVLAGSSAVMASSLARQGSGWIRVPLIPRPVKKSASPPLPSQLHRSGWEPVPGEGSLCSRSSLWWEFRIGVGLGWTVLSGVLWSGQSTPG